MILHFIVIITMIVSHYDTDGKLYNFELFELFELFYSFEEFYSSICSMLLSKYFRESLYKLEIKTQLLHKGIQLSMYRD